MSFYEDSDGNKYAVGADSVPKKLGSPDIDSIKLYKNSVVTAGSNETKVCSMDLEKGIYIVFSGDMDLLVTNYHQLRDRAPSGSNINRIKLSSNAYVIEAESDTKISINVGPCGTGSNGGGQGWLIALSLK